MKLCIPVAAKDQHGVVLGKTGAGKSSALRHLVEYLLRAGKRVCIIDPKGDWWGLKSSADGKGPGFPIITFGDFKEEDATDVPINAQSGKHVAELVSTGNRPAIVGFRGWMTSHMVQFWIDFASTLFKENEGELYLIIDEVHNFAPKGKIMDPQAGKCLHWTNRLMAEGRGLGMVVWIASQRPQKVHNDTLTSCETLVAMRVIHAADRGAVEDWIKGCGDPKIGKTVLDGLAQLARGSAYVWSPEIGFGPQIVEFPLFETFDSFAPPQLQKKVSRRTWADVDLNAVREKLATVIKESQANDPKELRKELNLARQQLMSMEGRVAVSAEVKEVPVIKEGELERLESVEGRMMAAGKEFKFWMDDFWKEVQALNATLNSAGVAAMHPNNRGMKLAPVKSASSPSRGLALPHPQSRETSPKPAPPPTHDVGKTRPDPDGVTPAMQRILNSLGWWYLAEIQAPSRHMVAFAAKFKVGGYFTNTLGAMKTRGLIDYPQPGVVTLTGEGQALVDPSDVNPTRAGLLSNVLEILPSAQSKIFNALINADGETGREELANLAGLNIGGYFTNMLGAMRTAGVIEYPGPGRVKLAGLFEALP